MQLQLSDLHEWHFKLLHGSWNKSVDISPDIPKSKVKVGEKLVCL